METEIKILKSSDVKEFSELISVFEVVFEMENLKQPGEEYLINLLKRDNFFAVVAKVDKKIIAGLTVYILNQYYSDKPLAYIYDLAVLPVHQRKGVGKNLISFTNQYCKKHGFEEVFVQADQIDDYAIDFYRLTNPSREEQVVHFSYNLDQNK